VYLDEVYACADLLPPNFNTKCRQFGFLKPNFFFAILREGGRLHNSLSCTRHLPIRVNIIVVEKDFFSYFCTHFLVYGRCLPVHLNPYFADGEEEDHCDFVTLQQLGFLRCDKYKRSIITPATKFACGSNGKGTHDAQETRPGNPPFRWFVYTSYVAMSIYYVH
jgi:hypothetical protein